MASRMSRRHTSTQREQQKLVRPVVSLVRETAPQQHGAPNSRIASLLTGPAVLDGPLDACISTTSGLEQPPQQHQQVCARSMWCVAGVWLAAVRRPRCARDRGNRVHVHACCSGQLGHRQPPSWPPDKCCVLAAGLASLTATHTPVVTPTDSSTHPACCLVRSPTNTVGPPRPRLAAGTPPVRRRPSGCRRSRPLHSPCREGGRQHQRHHQQLHAQHKQQQQQQQPSTAG
jgi:hypothetical protein